MSTKSHADEAKKKANQQISDEARRANQQISDEARRNLLNFSDEAKKAKKENQQISQVLLETGQAIKQLGKVLRDK